MGLFDHLKTGNELAESQRPSRKQIDFANSLVSSIEIYEDMLGKKEQYEDQVLPMPSEFEAMTIDEISEAIEELKDRNDVMYREHQLMDEMAKQDNYDPNDWDTPF